MTRNILFDHIQPLRGWGIMSRNNPAFHTGLLKFNHFGITLKSETLTSKQPLLWKTKSVKSINLSKSLTGRQA